MSTVNHYITRYVWVYVTVEDNLNVNVNAFVSPDIKGEPFTLRPTPFEYSLTRNDVRYNLKCEVQIPQALAIKIAGSMYDSEFYLVPKINAQRKIVNR